MEPVQIIVPAAGFAPAELTATVATLLSAGFRARVELLDPTPAQLREIRRALGARGSVRVAVAAGVRAGAPILVVPGPAGFAAGSLRRLRAQARVPGRVLTRVYLPGVATDATPASWHPEMVSALGWTLADLAGATHNGDRDIIDPADGRARHWVRGDELGVVVLPTGAGVAWSVRTGLRVDASDAWQHQVRGRVGRFSRALKSRAGRG